MRYRFKQYILDSHQGRLITVDGREIKLRPQAFSVLAYLVSRSPAVVSRDELLDAVWGHQALSVSGVAQAIREIRKALSDPAGDPKLISTRHRVGYQFIATVSIETDEPDSLAATPTPRSPRRRRQVMAVVAVVAALALPLGAWLFLSGEQPSGAASRPAVALMPFTAQDGASRGWLKTALPDLLGTELAADEAARLVSASEIEEAGVENLPTRGGNPEALAQLRRSADADYVVTGRFTPRPAEAVHVSVTLQSTSDTSATTHVSESGALADLPALTRAIAARLRPAMRLEPVDTSTVRLARQSIPADLEAQRLYYDGLAQLRALRLSDAIASLERAERMAPNSAAVLAALARALSESGRDAAAARIAMRASGLTQSLSRRERLEVEALSARLSGRWSEAVDRYSALVQFFPDERDYAFDLIDVQLQAGPAETARHTLEAIRERQPETALGARFWLAAHRIHDHMGVPEQALAAADRALAEARVSESTPLTSAALLARGRTRASTGRYDSGREDLERAAQLMAASGNQRGQADAFVALAEILQEQGEFALADERIETARSLYADIGFRKGAARCQRLEGLGLYMQGQHQDAIERYRQAIAGFEALGAGADVGETYGNLANAQLRAGLPNAALASYQQAREHYRKVGNRRGMAATRINHGMLLARQERLDDAVTAFEEAMGLFRTLGDLRGQAAAAGNLGAALQARGDAQGAMRLNHRAIELYRQMGEDRQLARVLYNVGLSERRRGRLDQAADLLEESAAIQSDLGASDFAAAALNALAGIRLWQAKVETARDLIARARSLDVAQPLQLAATDTMAGHVALAEGDFETAMENYDHAHERRSAAKATAWVLFSELDQARTELRRGNPGAAEQMAQKVALAYERARARQDQAAALLLVAECRAALGRKKAARAALDQVRALDVLGNSQWFQLRFSLMQGRLDDGDSGMRTIDWVIERAQESGFKTLSLAARLDKARRLQRKNDLIGARRVSEAVLEQAQAAGLLRLARLAGNQVAETRQAPSTDRAD